MADFIVPDCEIRKVNGRIYGAGSRIPGYSEEPVENKAPKEERVESSPEESQDKKSYSSYRSKKKRKKYSSYGSDDNEDSIVENLINNSSEEDKDE